MSYQARRMLCAVRKAGGCALSLNLPQKLYLVKLGVLPMDKNDWDRPGRGGLKSMLHPVTQVKVEDYPINNGGARTAREMHDYTDYVARPEIWAKLIELGHAGVKQDAWMVA